MKYQYYCGEFFPTEKNAYKNDFGGAFIKVLMPAEGTPAERLSEYLAIIQELKADWIFLGLRAAEVLDDHQICRETYPDFDEYSMVCYITTWPLGDREDEQVH